MAKIKFYITLCLLLLAFNLSEAKEEKTDKFFSCLLHVTDEEGEYSINVQEYTGKDKYCRRDNWESPSQGPVSYIIIKENKGKTSGYVIIHYLKKYMLCLPGKM